MDSDKTLEILIKMGIVGEADTEKARALLKNINRETLDGAAAGREATKSHHDLNEAEKEGSKVVEVLEKNHRAFHQVLHLIGHEAGPQAEAALAGLAAAGGAGGILLAVTAVKALAEWLAKVREEAEKAAQATLDLWEAERKAASDATDENRKYIESLHDVQAAIDASKAAQDLVTAKLKAREEQTKKILDYEEKIALLQAGGDKAAEERIKKIYEGKKSDADINSEARELQANRAALTQAEYQKEFARRTLDDAHAAAQTTLSKPEADKASAAQSSLDVLNEKLKEAATQVKLTGPADEAEKQLKDAEAFPSAADPNIPGSGGMNIIVAQQHLNRAKQAEEELASLRQQAAEQQAIVDRYDQAKKDATKAEDDAAAALRKYTDLVNSLSEKVTTGAAVLDIHRDTATATGNPPPPDNTRPLVPTAAGPDPRRAASAQALADMRQLEQALDDMGANGGGGFTGPQMQLIQRILTVVEGHKVAQDQVHDALVQLFAFQSNRDEGARRLYDVILSQLQNNGTSNGMSF